MTWQLLSFGGVTLPIGSPQLPVGTAPSYTAGVALPGGEYFDQEGASHAHPKLPYELRLRVTALAASHVALETAFFALTTLNGLRGTLIRLLADGVTQQWCTARLLQVPATGDVQNVRSQPLEMVFQVQSRWFSTTPQSVTGILSTVPKNITLVNAGSARVTDAIITVTAVGGVPITGLTIARTGYTEFAYTGTIAAGKALVIDCGAQSVVNDGADDYAHFALTANHYEAPWLRIPRAVPSGITVTVTRTFGSATDTAKFDYYEAWQ